jgi:hypothetical protein
MASSLRSLATVSLIALVVMVGCVPGLRTAKQPATPNQPAADRAQGGKSPAVQAADKPPFDKENLLASAPPPDKLPAMSGARGPTVQPSDLSNKDEITAAALLFGQGVPNAKHVKICYSKAVGGWSLFLYVLKGKKLTEEEYAWNKESREWEFYAAQKNLPANKMDIYLKGELPDEKCFVLR